MNYTKIYGTEIINTTKDEVKFDFGGKEHTVTPLGTLEILRKKEFKITNGYGAWKIMACKDSSGGITQLVVSYR